MSAIIFNRMIHNTDSSEPKDIEEFDDDNYDLNEIDFHSKSYLINFYKVGNPFLFILFLNNYFSIKIFQNQKSSNHLLTRLIINEKLHYVVISLYKNHIFR